MSETMVEALLNSAPLAMVVLGLILFAYGKTRRRE